MNWLDPNLQWVLFGSTLLGVAAGTLGCFAFLRGRSLMGDALAHAALPGVCIAFLIGEVLRSKNATFDSKSLALLLCGASVTGLMAAACVTVITRCSRLKEDAAQAIVLTVFFGIGVVFLTWIQHSGLGSQSGLDKFLFGQTAALVSSDVTLMATVAGVLCVMCAAFYKELKLLCFDAPFGSGLGLPMQRIDMLLLIMIVAAVVIGLQAVGVVLISALLITPPAAARFWTDKLSWMVLLSAILGGGSGLLGSLISAWPGVAGLPTGPMIVVAATIVFGLSVLFAPRRGVLARAWRALSMRHRVRRENILRAMFEIAESKTPHSDEPLPSSTQLPTISENELQQKRRGDVAGTLHELVRSGFVENSGQQQWRFTKAGLTEAHRIVRSHRLWEMFLMYETTLGAVSVDRDADEVEHFLPPETVAQLEAMLRKNNLEPRLKPV